MPEPYIIVIPARYASSRYPGKMLVPLNGKPMILHTIDRARESAASQVVVATDDERIADLCRQVGADVEMTDPEHPSGTDRIAQVAVARAWPKETRIVGLQGDEPATPASHLYQLALNLSQFPDADMATMCVAIANEHDYQNPNRVKVVCDKAGFALYFSRASIPWRRDARELSRFPGALLHIGLYAYRCSFLSEYHTLGACELEQEEQLEQLRVLYHGGRIHVEQVADAPASGVDQPDDVASAEAALYRLASEANRL